MYIYIYIAMFSNSNTAILGDDGLVLLFCCLQVPLLARHGDFNHAETPGALLAAIENDAGWWFQPIT